MKAELIMYLVAKLKNSKYIDINEKNTVIHKLFYIMWECSLIYIDQLSIWEIFMCPLFAYCFSSSDGSLCQIALFRKSAPCVNF